MSFPWKCPKLEWLNAINLKTQLCSIPGQILRSSPCFMAKSLVSKVESQHVKFHENDHIFPAKSPFFPLNSPFFRRWVRYLHPQQLGHGWTGDGQAANGQEGQGAANGHHVHHQVDGEIGLGNFKHLEEMYNVYFIYIYIYYTYIMYLEKCVLVCNMRAYMYLNINIYIYICNMNTYGIYV